MQLRFWRHDLRLAHRWAIAGGAGTEIFKVVLVELDDGQGVVGLGEAAPAGRHGESAAKVLAFLQKVAARQLAFDRIEDSMTYLAGLAPGDFSAKSALNVALLDGAAKKAGQALHDFLQLGFQEGRHTTSFSIGVATPEVIRRKVLAAEPFPMLKLKLGGRNDRATLAALRDVAPAKPVRVDANEGWPTKEQALEMIEWLARDSHIQFVEQPMPANAGLDDLRWLKQRSPLPLFADELHLTAPDAARCVEGFHGVNVKLSKAGGVSAAVEALKVARAAGLQTMLGCMIETSVLISAAAHLAGLADFLDLDGNLLVTNDPYQGVTADKGVLSFAGAPERFGLRVSKRETH
jgi:L-Ala-D/L-Glu epimerase